jgi:hypothetical protein
MKKEGKPAYLDFYAAQPADSWEGHTEPAPTPRQGQEGRPGQVGVPAQAQERPQGSEQEQMGPSALPRPGDLLVVGIPGGVAGLLALHEKFGKLPRERVIAPAIQLAEGGFPVGQILADFITSGADKLRPFPKAYALYFPGGKPLGAGATVRNPELAESLRRIARDGRRGFYEGVNAQELIATLNTGKPARHPRHGIRARAFVAGVRTPLHDRAPRQFVDRGGRHPPRRAAARVL